MTEDEYKLDNPFHDKEPEPEPDLYLNKLLIEFYNEVFYCNNNELSHEKMIEEIDDIANIKHNRSLIKKSKPIYIDLFNMRVDIDELEDYYSEFEKTY